MTEKALEIMQNCRCMLICGDKMMIIPRNARGDELIHEMQNGMWSNEKEEIKAHKIAERNAKLAIEAANAEKQKGGRNCV